MVDSIEQSIYSNRCLFINAVSLSLVSLLDLGLANLKGTKLLYPLSKHFLPDKLINISQFWGRFVDAMKTEQVANHIFDQLDQRQEAKSRAHSIHNLVIDQAKILRSQDIAQTKKMRETISNMNLLVQKKSRMAN